jgi:hypothetical protein
MASSCESDDLQLNFSLWGSQVKTNPSKHPSLSNGSINAESIVFGFCSLFQVPHEENTASI